MKQETLVNKAAGNGTMDLQSISGKKDSWRVEIAGDVLRLTPADGSGALEIGKVDRYEKFDITTTLGGKRCLAIKKPVAVELILDHTQFEILSRWLGPLGQRDLVVALKENLSSNLWFGLFCMTVIPFPGEPIRWFDIAVGSLGIPYIVIYFAAKWKPARALLLIGAILDLIFVISFSIFLVGISPLWLFFLMFLVPLVLYTSWGHWSAYRSFEGFKGEGRLGTRE